VFDLSLLGLRVHFFKRVHIEQDTHSWHNHNDQFVWLLNGLDFSDIFFTDLL
jgi:hypothetical protein